MLRQATGDADLANAVIYGEDHPSIGPQERAMIAYARRLTREPWAMAEGDVENLLATGLSEEQGLDVALIACLFNFMTRLADGLGVEVEVPKAQSAETWLEQREGPEWEFLRLPPPPVP